MTISEDMKRLDLRDIQREKAAEIQRLAEHDAERARIEQRINELSVTERTLARLMSVDLPEPERSATETVNRKKPEGIPTIYIMAVTLLRESGVHWMEGQDFVQAIRNRWWPTADSNDITPTLWRLAKTGKLVKNGTKYALPAGVRGPVKELGKPGAVSVQ